MKNVLYLFLIISLKLYGQNERCDCNITVYGDIHLTRNNDSATLNNIYETQQWLYQNIKEIIVVVEGMSQFGPITTDTVISGILSEVFSRYGLIITKKEALKLLKEESKFDVRARYILENKKIIFGGENDSLWRLFILNPYLTSIIENVDLRSASILKNTFKVCKIFPKSNIAIIIGRKHLAWFLNRGYKVFDRKK